MTTITVCMIAIAVLTTLCQISVRSKDLQEPGQEIQSRFLLNGIHPYPCGSPRIPPNIVIGKRFVIGGGDAFPHSWPWQVSMQLFGNHWCGGVLARNNESETVVITAAHCFDFNGTRGRLAVPRFWTMEFGRHDLSQVEATKKSVNVTKINIHPSWNMITRENDIAVMILADNTFADTDEIHPICITHEDPSAYVGERCFITGWGKTSNASSSDTLRQVMVNVYPESDCSRFIGAKFDDQTMICAGDINGGKDSCSGDSGGPLACQKFNTWRLVGITSWGRGCGLIGLPGLYTNVHNYLNWLSNNME